LAKLHGLVGLTGTGRQLASLFIYLGKEGLTFLKSGLLPFVRPQELDQPFLAGNTAFAQLQQQQINHQDYLQHLKQQYQKLPDHLKSMVTFEYFVEQSEKKRPQIEAGIQQAESGVVKRPDLSDYRILRCFSNAAGISLWAGKEQSGLVLEIDPAGAGWRGAHYGKQPQKLGCLNSVEHWAPQHDLDWLLNQPMAYGVNADEEWRLVRPLASADKVIEIKGQERAMYRLPYKALRRVIVGCRWDDQKLKEIQSYMQRDLNLRQSQLAQLQLNPASMELMINDL